MPLVQIRAYKREIINRLTELFIQKSRVGAYKIRMLFKSFSLQCSAGIKFVLTYTC